MQTRRAGELIGSSGPSTRARSPRPGHASRPSRSATRSSRSPRAGSGAHAEYLAIRADGPVAAMPTRLGYDVAAASTEGAHYALSHIRRAGYPQRAGRPGLRRDRRYRLRSCPAPRGDRRRRDGGLRHGAPRPRPRLRRPPGPRLHHRGVRDRRPPLRRRLRRAVGKAWFGQCRRLLKPGGIYMSTGPGPGYQNLALPLISPLLPGARVLFAFPKIDQAMVRYFRELMESGSSRPSSTGGIRGLRSWRPTRMSRPAARQGTWSSPSFLETAR